MQIQKMTAKEAERFLMLTPLSEQDFKDLINLMDDDEFLKLHEVVYCNLKTREEVVAFHKANGLWEVS